ncbi:MAG TPA: outer membrane beta-barrel protein [Candidatus Polarisedimenticolaceae bacterium]|nr:outer membrane beta-barrel protein [Candidatus Polarisedimenticolaceae bacterium]
MARAMRWGAVLLVLFLLAAPVEAMDGDVSLLVGRNALSEDRLDEAGVDSLTDLGALVNLDFQWPVVLAVDLIRGSGDALRGVPAEFNLAFQTDVDTLDLHLGARYFFRKTTPWRPYVGGGLAWTTLDVRQVETGDFGGPETAYQTVVVDDDDSGLGFWLGGGLLYRGNRWQVGGDLRYADTSATLQPELAEEGLKLDSGGLHAGVFVGWAW